VRRNESLIFIHKPGHNKPYCFAPIRIFVDAKNNLTRLIILIPSYKINSAGDHALTIRLGIAITEETHQKVMALFHHLKKDNISAVKDIIPAYTSVTVVYDIMQAKKHTQISSHDYIRNAIQQSILQCNWDAAISSALIEIPVCYDESFGIDLRTMAEQKKISIEEIINIHTSTVYHVYMLGFLPGFAYMGIVDSRIATARLQNPRLNVPAGSVGIAGNQTGIYSFDSPGGWTIIGRAALSLFDAAKEKPCLFEPGNRIQFVPVSKETFEQIKQQR